MGQPTSTKPQERRTETRRELIGVLPGEMVGDSGRTFDVMTVDVTSNGMGLLMEPGPYIGEEIRLQISKDRFLLFEVRWVRQDNSLGGLGESFKELRRCGLLYLGQDNLIDVLSEFDNLQVGE